MSRDRLWGQGGPGVATGVQARPLATPPTLPLPHDTLERTITLPAAGMSRRWATSAARDTES